MFYKFEEWKEIFDGYYKISNFGIVKRNKKGRSTYIGKILKPSRDDWGYPYIVINAGGFRKTYKVHVLVAKAFLGEREEGFEINHKNPDKYSPGFNYIWNLEYVTHSKNMKHAFKNGLIDAKGSKNGNAKINETDVKKIRRLGKKGLEYKEIGMKFSLASCTVGQIVREEIWKHV